MAHTLRIIALIIAALLPAYGTAQIREPAPSLRVVPDHADWRYRPGETVKFHVSFAGVVGPAEGVAIKYRVGPEMMPAEEKAATLSRTGLTIEAGTLAGPGFLRCSVTA